MAAPSQLKEHFHRLVMLPCGRLRRLLRERRRGKLRRRARNLKRPRRVPESELMARRSGRLCHMSQPLCSIRPCLLDHAEVEERLEVEETVAVEELMVLALLLEQTRPLQAKRCREAPRRWLLLETEAETSLMVPGQTPCQLRPGGRTVRMLPLQRSSVDLPRHQSEPVVNPGQRVLRIRMEPTRVHRPMARRVSHESPLAKPMSLLTRVLITTRGASTSPGTPTMVVSAPAMSVASITVRSLRTLHHSLANSTVTVITPGSEATRAQSAAGVHTGDEVATAPMEAPRALSSLTLTFRTTHSSRTSRSTSTANVRSKGFRTDSLTTGCPFAPPRYPTRPLCTAPIRFLLTLTLCMLIPRCILVL